jgi:hypothetical protein
VGGERAGAGAAAGNVVAAGLGSGYHGPVSALGRSLRAGRLALVLATAVRLAGCQPAASGPAARPADGASRGAVGLLARDAAGSGSLEAGRGGAVSGLPSAGGDAGRVGSEPPGLLLRAAELAEAQADRATARALLELALAGIARQQGGEVAIQVAPAYGLADPDFAGQEGADAVIAASGERAAVAHGRVLSIIELTAGYAVRRLEPHPARLRRVVSDRSGQHLATLADDGVARLRSLSGEPGHDYLLLSPRAPGSSGQPGTPSPHRAPWLDFSPDARHLFLLDCGVPASGDCPLRRLRVVAADSGELLQTLAAGPGELVDYTADRAGTLAVLFAGSPPRLFTASTGQELQLASAVSGPAAAACLGSSRRPEPGERALLVSPERRWLVTLAPPATLCLWELAARRLTAAVPLGERPRLESLLSTDAGPAAVLSVGERGERRAYLLFPQTGQRFAAPRGLAAVLPLDDGGALMTGRRPGDRGPRGPEVFRLGADSRLQRLAVPQLLALPCLFAAPEAVQGDGALALFSPTERAASGSCPPALVALSGPARLWPLPLPGQAPLVAADFIAEQQLVVIDAAAQLQVLVGARVEYATPRFPAAVTRLDFAAAGERLDIGGADGLARTLGLATGQLGYIVRPPAAPPILPADRVPPASAIDRAPLAPAADRVSPALAAERAAPAPAVDRVSPALAADRAPPGAAPVLTAVAGPLRAEVKPAAAESAGFTLSLREPDRAGVRWQVALDRPPTALAFSPDGRWLLTGGGDGAVIWRGLADGRVRLRLQLVDGGAVLMTPDGRFELLGQLARPADYLACRAASYPLAYSLCRERLFTPGLLAQALR